MTPAAYVTLHGVARRFNLTFSVIGFSAFLTSIFPLIESVSAKIQKYDIMQKHGNYFQIQLHHLEKVAPFVMADKPNFEFLNSSVC
jgi:hypothetical protein